MNPGIVRQERGRVAGDDLDVTIRESIRRAGWARRRPGLDQGADVVVTFRPGDEAGDDLDMSIGHVPFLRGIVERPEPVNASSIPSFRACEE
jgi:hypothetical protein